MLKEIILALSFEKGKGAKSIRDIFSNLSENEIINRYSHLLNSDKFKSTEEDLFKKKISYLTFTEENYPTLLKNIPDFPVILFYKGTYNLEKINNSLTIVGTRKLSSYGKLNVSKFTYELANLGFSTISGMALGIDTLVHNITLDNNGYTVAVLGAPVDRPSPLSNQYVYDRIISEGSLVISEYIPGTQISPGMFAHRNRIVAGLSLGTLIVEAGLDSGSLITANLAFDYDRDVFSIPGNIGQPGSQGNNKLIKDGKAKLTENINDIISEFGFGRKEIINNISSDTLQNLTDSERSIYDKLLSEPRTLDEMAFLLNKSVSELSSILSILELKNVIRKEETGKFHIV